MDPCFGTIKKKTSIILIKIRIKWIKNKQNDDHWWNLWNWQNDEMINKMLIISRQQFLFNYKYKCLFV